MMFLRLFVIAFTLYGLTFAATASTTTLDVAADAPVWMRLGADILLYLHMGGGALGMIAGTVAILSRKGQTRPPDGGQSLLRFHAGL